MRELKIDRRRFRFGGKTNDEDENELEDRFAIEGPSRVRVERL